MNTIFVFILSLASLCFSDQAAFGQKKNRKPIDSLLEAHSEKWKVKLHRGIFGMARPELGPYITASVEKVDSPVLRKRTKDGSYSGVSISSDGWDWDLSKYQTVEKKKAYRMLVAGSADTAELLFSIYTVSKEKHLTFLGELMSRSDEDKNRSLGSSTTISGVLATDDTTPPARFLIQDSVGGKEDAGPSPTTRITKWYMILGKDSLYTEPMISRFGSFGDKYSWESQTGVFVNNSTGNRIAALKFGMPGDLSNPFIAWIRKDIDSSQQQAVASLFAVQIGAMTH